VAGLAALALIALAVWGLDLPRERIDWQPGRAWTEPWRWWSAAFVHLSARHLLANVAGLGVLACFAMSAGPGAARALWRGWLCAWPLTQLMLLVEPRLGHYGGLSGVLHAGIAIVALHLAGDATAPRAERITGLLVWLGLLAKVLSEAPWAGPVRDAGWDFPVAPIAHASGLVAGTAVALASALLARRRRGSRTTAPEV